MKSNGQLKFEDHTDNHEVAFSIRAGGTRDITQTAKAGQATKGEIRELFIKFLQSSPEFHDLSREEQIREFNILRREVRRPKIDAEILLELHVPEA